MSIRPTWYDYTRSLNGYLNPKMRKEFLRIPHESQHLSDMRWSGCWFERKDGAYDLVTYEEYIRKTQKMIDKGEFK